MRHLMIAFQLAICHSSSHLVIVNLQYLQCQCFWTFQATFMIYFLISIFLKTHLCFLE